MLRPELVTPIHSQIRLIAVALGVGAVATLIAAPRIEVWVPSPAIATDELPKIAATEVAAAEAAPAAPVTDVNMVFRAGGALYMKLAAPAAKQPHAKLRLFDRGRRDDWTVSAIADVAVADLPAAHHAWIGKQVIVDGTCTAAVAGFAVVAKLTGTPGYAGEDVERWTARTVFEHGEKMLAARLDGCDEGTFARDAALPPIVLPVVIEDSALARQARAKLLASKPARDAQKRWVDTEGWLDHHAPSWYRDESAVFSTIVVRHPTTNITFVSTHAKVEYGCGGVEISIWGLYRVDASGKLVAVQQRDHELFTIDRLIDLEGDGELEVIGRPWLQTDLVLQHESGEPIDRLVLPFYGCPC